jgi:hypothetical protein
MSCRSAPVDAREIGGGGADRLRDGDRVLEKPVAVGLVVDLRRRRLAEARPALGALAKEALQQPPQLRVLNRRQQLAQVLLEAVERHARTARQLGRVVLLRLRQADLRQLHLRAPALAGLEDALDVDRSAGLGQRVARLRFVPGDGLDAAAAVAEHEPQPGIAVLLLAQVALAHPEHTLHLLAGDQGAHADAGARLGGVRFFDQGLLGHRIPK